MTWGQVVTILIGIAITAFGAVISARVFIAEELGRRPTREEVSTLLEGIEDRAGHLYAPLDSVSALRSAVEAIGSTNTSDHTRIERAIERLDERRR